MKSDRVIDYKKLKRKVFKFAEHSSLSSADLATNAVAALEQWEQCGGRAFPGFHDLLDAIERATE